MNKALQKWADSKLKTLKMWSKEYDELCKAEGIKENPLVSFALDREYIASIKATVEDEKGMPELLFYTEALFLKKGEWRKLIIESMLK